MFSPDTILIEAGKPFTFVIEVHGLNEKTLEVLDSQDLDQLKIHEANEGRIIYVSIYHTIASRLSLSFRATSLD